MHSNAKCERLVYQYCMHICICPEQNSMIAQHCIMLTYLPNTGQQHGNEICACCNILNIIMLTGKFQQSQCTNRCCYSTCVQSLLTKKEKAKVIIGQQKQFYGHYHDNSNQPPCEYHNKQSIKMFVVPSGHMIMQMHMLTAFMDMLAVPGKSLYWYC